MNERMLFSQAPWAALNKEAQARLGVDQLRRALNAALLEAFNDILPTMK